MQYTVIVGLLSFIMKTVICSIEVPLLAWGTGLESISYDVPAMKKLSTSEILDNFLEPLVSHKTPILVFLEEDLGTEDFGWKDDNGNSAFASVQKSVEQNPVAYFSYVKYPVKALQALNHHFLTDMKDLPEESKVMIVKMGGPDGHETRVEMLRRHDKLIAEKCSRINKENSKAVCILTADQKSKIESANVFSGRHLLETGDEEKNNASAIVFYKDDVGLVYSKSPLILVTGDKICYLDPPTTPPTKQGVSPSIAAYVNSNCSTTERVRLVINFSTDNRTWQLSSININIGAGPSTTLNTTLNTISELGSSIGYSYHTPALVVFESADKKTQLKFNSIQAEYLSKKKSKVEFSPADDAVTFFTIPILSGLFVTSLLVTIVLLGLSMIFDIKTMDQFDDPKGKTVTINASE